jgi:imidazolonepropionase-like amidohydrolase
METRNHVDMRNAVEFAKAEHLDFFVGGPEDTWKIVPFLKAQGARVVLQPSQNVPGGDDDPVDAVYRTAAILHEAGVPFAFGSVGGVGLDARSLPAQAGYAVAYGLPWDAALRALTITPAMFYGIADRYGTIERGKRANIVVAQGDILDVTTLVRHVFIDGRPVTLETVDSIEFERYRDKVIR